VGPRGRFQAQTESFLAVSQRIHLGALVAGIVLVIFGLLLLGGTQFQWRGLLDAVLALVGLILIVRSRSAANVRGLLVVGVVLGLVMLSVWRADVPLAGGMRFQTVTPITPAELATPFRQSAGTLTIDLTRYPPGPLPPIIASVGVGRLVVVEPPGTVLFGTAIVGGGHISVGQASKNGAGAWLPLYIPGAPTRGPADLRVGLGDLEVQTSGK
jgi:drug/metabolite transporter (DMT)-like permease